MENPQTGNLKNRDIMKDKPFYDVDYCMYSIGVIKKEQEYGLKTLDW